MKNKVLLLLGAVCISSGMFAVQHNSKARVANKAESEPLLETSKQLSRIGECHLIQHVQKEVEKHQHEKSADKLQQDIEYAIYSFSACNDRDTERLFWRFPDTAKTLRLMINNQSVHSLATADAENTPRVSSLLSSQGPKQSIKDAISHHVKKEKEGCEQKLNDALSNNELFKTIKEQLFKITVPDTLGEEYTKENLALTYYESYKHLLAACQSLAICYKNNKNYEQAYKHLTDLLVQTINDLKKLKLTKAKKAHNQFKKAKMKAMSSAEKKEYTKQIKIFETAFKNIDREYKKLMDKKSSKKTNAKQTAKKK